MKPLAFGATALCLMLTPALAAEPDPAFSGDGGVSAFYRWDGPPPDGPGRMLRRERLEPRFSIPGAGAAERVLYSSTRDDDATVPIAVSGALFLPPGKPPEGGWPIVSWAHGTTGIADVCAPSQLERSRRDKAYLAAWLGQGFAVVATDYRGLGTPGVHPYLLYSPEGKDVLDLARAALAAEPGRLRNQVLTVGQSQGSGAALGAALLAPAYAPDLKILGTVATGIVAVAADPAGAEQVPVVDENGLDTDYGDSAYAMLHLLGTDQALSPGLSPPDVVTEAGRTLMATALHHCMGDVMKEAIREHLLVSRALNDKRKALDALEAKRGAFASTAIATPVFIGTGLGDEAADPRVQYNFVSALCHAGTRVEFHTYPGLSHGATVNASLKDSIPFATRLRRGEAAASSCAGLHPPAFQPFP